MTPAARVRLARRDLVEAQTQRGDRDREWRETSDPGDRAWALARLQDARAAVRLAEQRLDDALVEERRAALRDDRRPEGCE